VVILAGAILGAAWILRPASVEQVTQVELQRREELMRWAQERFTEAEARECAVSAAGVPTSRPTSAQKRPSGMFGRTDQRACPRGRPQRRTECLRPVAG
jgi:hypothetical protein